MSDLREATFGLNNVLFFISSWLIWDECIVRYSWDIVRWKYKYLVNSTHIRRLWLTLTDHSEMSMIGGQAHNSEAGQYGDWNENDAHTIMSRRQFPHQHQHVIYNNISCIIQKYFVLAIIYQICRYKEYAYLKVHSHRKWHVSHLLLVAYYY